MELNVVWTVRAKNNYLQILDYIVGKFGKAAGRKYHQKINGLIALVSRNPAIGTRQNKGDLRAIVLFKRTTVFYHRSKNPKNY